MLKKRGLFVRAPTMATGMDERKRGRGFVSVVGDSRNQPNRIAPSVHTSPSGDHRSGFGSAGKSSFRGDRQVSFTLHVLGLVWRWVA